MNDKLTYEEALKIAFGAFATVYDEYCNFVSKSREYKGYEIFLEDYEAIKKLEEAIKKAKKYDELNKEE